MWLKKQNPSTVLGCINRGGIQTSQFQTWQFKKNSDKLEEANVDIPWAEHLNKQGIFSFEKTWTRRDVIALFKKLLKECHREESHYLNSMIPQSRGIFVLTYKRANSSWMLGGKNPQSDKQSLVMGMTTEGGNELLSPGAIKQRLSRAFLEMV